MHVAQRARLNIRRPTAHRKTKPRKLIRITKHHAARRTLVELRRVAGPARPLDSYSDIRGSVAKGTAPARNVRKVVGVGALVGHTGIIYSRHSSAKADTRVLGIFMNKAAKLSKQLERVDIAEGLKIIEKTYEDAL